MAPEEKSERKVEARPSMTTFTIRISEPKASELEALARDAGVTPEELLQRSVESWLSRGGGDFDEAAAYVLEKNAELYRRLA